eukprot:758417-Hanusia_phi.AAC.5
MDLTTQLDEIKKLLSASPGPGTSPLRLILPIRPVQIGKESIVETVVVSHLVPDMRQGFVLLNSALPPVDVPWSLNELHVSSQHVDCQGSSVSLLRLVLAASMPVRVSSARDSAAADVTKCSGGVRLLSPQARRVG